MGFFIIDLLISHWLIRLNLNTFFIYDLFLDSVDIGLFKGWAGSQSFNEHPEQLSVDILGKCQPHWLSFVEFYNQTIVALPDEFDFGVFLCDPKTILKGLPNYLNIEIVILLFMKANQYLLRKLLLLNFSHYPLYWFQSNRKSFWLFAMENTVF